MTGQVRRGSEAVEGTISEDWGTLTWLANHGLTGSLVTVGRVLIGKGRSNPRHCHDNCEEVLHLLRGRLNHSVGDEWIALEAGDTLVVPPGVMHSAESVGDTDADMVVAYSSGERGFRLEDVGWRECPS
jgi:quercetin dioxygenase-like cupin family protein